MNENDRYLEELEALALCDSCHCDDCQKLERDEFKSAMRALLEGESLGRWEALGKIING